MALSEICRELNNYFEYKERLFGSFKIVDSTLTYEGGVMSDFLQDGQYFRIVGSVFNDGVHVFNSPIIEGLHDETFDGAIWAMAVPPDLIALSTEIDAWLAKYGDVDSAAMSPYNSESFGGYSYSKSSGGSSNGGSGGGADWKNVFGSRLNKWRKIRCRY